MGLVVLPALIPDITACYDAYFEAFKGERLLEILFPGGITPEFRVGHTAHTLQYWHHSKVQYTFKCVDTDTGETVGMGLYDVFLEETPDADRKNPGVTWLEGEQRARAEAVLNPQWEAKEKLIGGRRHVYCHVVAVRPEHQKRGAGALLTRCGIDMAEAAGVPVYLESTPAAHRLYQKLGFERVGAVVHSGEGSDVEVPLMVRMPKVAGGGVVSFEDWRARG